MDNIKLKPVISAKSKFFFGWLVVAGSWIMLFIMGATASGIFFKPMLDEFGWDRATLSYVAAVGLLVFAVLSPFLGRLIDRFGPRLMLFVSLGAQTVGSTALALTTNIFHVYIGRFLSEIRYVHATQIITNRWFVKKRGLALGIVSTGLPIGTMVLSPVSQYLVLVWGWRTSLFFWAALGIILILPLLIIIRNKPEDKGLTPDGDNFVNETVGTFSGPQPAGKGMKSKKEIGSNLKEVAGMRSFWLLAFSQLFCGTGCGLLMTHTIIFATDLGYSEMIGATLLSIQGGINLLGALITGHMSDRFARNRVLPMTHLIRCISFITLAVTVVAGGASLWMLYLGMALFGFGWFTTSPLAAGLVADLFGNYRMGTIIGFTNGFHMVGAAIGTYAGGITYQLTGSYLMIFAVQGVLEFLAASFVYLIRKQPGQIIID